MMMMMMPEIKLIEYDACSERLNNADSNNAVGLKSFNNDLQLSAPVNVNKSQNFQAFLVIF